MTREDFLRALEEGRRTRPTHGATLRAIRRLGASPPRSLADLVRFHEALLFHAAYPENAAVRRAALRELARIPNRVRRLAAAGEDFSALDLPESAGIAGTRIATTFSFDFLSTLVARHGQDVRADWEAFDREDRLGAALPRFAPLLEEEAIADANVPYPSWLDSARGRRAELPWLLERFQSLPGRPEERAELFDGIGLPIVWDLSPSVSRTLARAPANRPFLHPERLLARADIDLARELAGPRLPLRRLPAAQARRRLDLARDAGGVRYRELYGFTCGDPTTARVVDAGRGCEIALFGLPPERRLPLRAGYAAFVTKNGIPVAYVEGLAIFERIEVGFNVYYTFREGESAWIYARILKLFRQALGVTSFSIDPYQIGFENEEAIASGAFWFYRKLGFRSTSRQLRAVTAQEEEKLAADPGRRTPARVLRRFAQRNLLFDAPGASGAAADWEDFHVRRLGLAVNRRMARDFGGGAEAIRKASSARVARLLEVDLARWPPLGRRAFESLALVLDCVKELPRWTAGEKRAAAEILRAKSAREEGRYLTLMQRHRRMREAFLELGSRP